MKTKYYFKIVVVFSTLFIVENHNAQVTTPFEVRYESYIQGNVTMISNQILNRKSGRTDANSPYNDRTDKSKLNDEFEMAYIDIDDNPDTFSSSEASLQLKEVANKKIVYAGLYWSATYPYNSGKRDQFWEFKAIDSKREPVENILLKLPEADTYLEIKGSLLFDGIKNPMLKKTAPYVAYADITSLVQSLSTPNGSYTIANIRATQGKISGGSAAGWMIYFVYEDPMETHKFVVSYDGFAGITARPHEVDFSGFRVLPNGNIHAQLGIAALEGDLTLDGDQLEIKSDTSSDYVSIEHPLKPKQNFFNSSLVLHNNYFEDRKPASLNTLGFDTALFELENSENILINNQTQKVTLKLKTNGDNYHFFWTAFTVESEPLQIKEEPTIMAILELNMTYAIIDSTANVTLEKQESTELKRQQMHKEREESVLTRKEKFISKIEMTTASELSKSTASSQRKVALPGENFIIPQQKKGYYVVANVFAKPRNAERFTAHLKSLGIAADYFINPQNNYRYVYVSYSENWEEALNVYYSDVNGNYSGEMWIMIVNTELQNDSIVLSSKQRKDLK
ncbi:MAG: SPOR domain-containing protein [Flavobacterium sp.]